MWVVILYELPLPWVGGVMFQLLVRCFLSVNSITQKDMNEFTLNLGMVDYGAEKGLTKF